MSKYDDLFDALHKANEELLTANPEISAGQAFGVLLLRAKELLTQRGGMEHFEAFWKLYPRKVGKDAAAKAWFKMEGDTHWDLIRVNVSARISSKQWEKTPDRIQFIPHATTYLNQRRWLDEGITATKSGYRDV